MEVGDGGSERGERKMKKRIQEEGKENGEAEEKHTKKMLKES